MTNNTETVVRRWTDGINAHDADAALQNMADDCIFVNRGTGRRTQGHAEFAEDLTDLFNQFSNVNFETTRLFVDGKTYCKVWVLTGTLPDGQPIRVHGAGLGEVRDGLIASVTEYWNPAEIGAQVPAPM